MAIVPPTAPGASRHHPSSVVPAAPPAWTAPAEPQRVGDVPLAICRAATPWWPARTIHPKGREIAFTDVGGRELLAAEGV